MSAQTQAIQPRARPVPAGVRKEASMPETRLKEFLDKEHVKYVSIDHSPAFTAQEIAAAAHIPGRELAKSVIVKIDGELAMIVVPASDNVRLANLRETLGAKKVELADEDEFKKAFPDCETGAMPPFGNLYGMNVFVSQALREDDEIAFNAGSHSELIRLTYADYERLVHPTPLAN
jgi:Ala-tRNA(Pro) deacylase